MHALNIVFAGTPEFAAQHLDALLGSPHNVIAVYTQPDRAAGRGKQLQASPVKTLAISNNIPVYQPANFKELEDKQALASHNPDVLIVVAYGLILPQAVLDIPRLGCINVHASILPRWRGAAPIERALLAGDAQTGVTIMQMDKGLDTGNMLLTATTPIYHEDDRQSLEERLAEVGRQALLSALSQIDKLRGNAQTQDDSLSTYASKLTKDEALIHWNNNAEAINRTIRCGIGRTPAYCFLNGERVRILKAKALSRGADADAKFGEIVGIQSDALHVACQDSTLEVSVMQFPGKNALPVSDLLNSKRDVLALGECFTSVDVGSS
jgi:methionyl-tRNA formyltransferase